MRSILLRLLAAVGAWVLIVTVTPLVGWWTSWLARWDDTPAGIMIVLTGDHLDTPIMGRQTYWRSVYAVWVWRQEHPRQIIITGDPPCATAMRDFLVFHGVPQDAIVLETESRSTRESALHTAALLRGAAGEKRLVTSDFHAFRASRAFAAAGLRVHTEGYPDGRKRAQQWAMRWEVFLDLAVETAKVVGYAVRGWI